MMKMMVMIALMRILHDSNDENEDGVAPWRITTTGANHGSAFIHISYVFARIIHS